MQSVIKCLFMSVIVRLKHVSRYCECGAKALSYWQAALTHVQ